MKHLDSRGRVKRRRWPHAATLEIDARENSFPILLCNEGIIGRPFQLKRQSAVIGQSKSKPDSSMRLEPNLRSQRVALVLRNRNGLIRVEQFIRVVPEKQTASNR